MKKLTLALLAVFVLPILTASAQQLKFAVFDMPRAAREYYKTAQIEAELKKDAQSFADEMKNRQETLKGIAEKGQALQRDRNSSVTSDERRKELDKQAQTLSVDYKKSAQEARAFEVQQRRALEQKRQRLLQAISEDIKKIVTAIGERDKVNFIFNSNGLGAPLYNSGVPDITDEVILNLNAKAPKAAAAAVPN